jgi:negative regulator of sigma-B (phosphoserine phosphatase)
VGPVKKYKIDSFIVEQGLEEVSGDIGFIQENDQEVFIGLIDGSGHGPEAREVAEVCRKYIEDNRGMELAPLIKSLHDFIRGSRGCVAIIGSLDLENLQLNYVGMGNICLRKFGVSDERALLGEGVIGYNISTPKEKRMQLQNGDVLIFHSDGIKSQFGINDYPEIVMDDAKNIAINIVRKFGKNDDDVTCIALRCTQIR